MSKYFKTRRIQSFLCFYCFGVNEQTFAFFPTKIFQYNHFYYWFSFLTKIYLLSLHCNLSFSLAISSIGSCRPKGNLNLPKLYKKTVQLKLFTFYIYLFIYLCGLTVQLFYKRVFIFVGIILNTKQIYNI